MARFGLARVVCLVALGFLSACMDLPSLRPPPDSLASVDGAAGDLSDGVEPADPGAGDLDAVPDDPGSEGGGDAGPGDPGGEGTIEDPGPQDPGPQDPGPQDPGPGDEDPGVADLGPMDPGSEDPAAADLGPADLGPTDPGALDSGAGEDVEPRDPGPGGDGTDEDDSGVASDLGEAEPDAGDVAGGDALAHPCTTSDDCDSSGLAPCLAAVCDPVERVCVPSAVPVGSPCVPAEALPECHVGSCGITGECEAVPGLEGLSCGTPDACVSPACQAGTCRPGPVRDCNDDNACTDDGCDPATGCTHLPNAATCAPSQCIGRLWVPAAVCSGGQCTSPEPLACSDSIACTVDGCDAANGCTHQLQAGTCLIDGQCWTDGTVHGKCLACLSGMNPRAWTYVAGQACDDGDPCTQADQCVEGYTSDDGCFGRSYPCDDGLVCTTDACDGMGGCTHEVSAGTCLIDGACRKDGDAFGKCFECVSALSRSGWSYVAGRSCSDGDPCTSGDRCVDGGDSDADCKGTAYSCDDGLACTLDSCDGTGKCGHAVVDGWCLIDAACFVAGTVHGRCFACNPGLSRTAWSYAPGQACDDGDPCSTGDVCSLAGSSDADCKGPTPRNCADSDPCTIDACSYTTGCTHLAYSCDDELACTVDGCDGAGGCMNTPSPGWCVIDRYCYAAGQTDPYDACRVCKPDVSQTGWTPAADGVACAGATCTGSGGLTFTAARTCLAGACTGGGAIQNCDDGVYCTTDYCNTGGCGHRIPSGCFIDGQCWGQDQANPLNWCQVCNPDWDPGTWDTVGDGTVCSFGSCNGLVFTASRTCVAAECTGGGAQTDCNDGNDCTRDSCDVNYGCFHENLGLGTACTGGACDGQGHCMPVCGTTTCPYMSGYTASCNGSGFCQYLHVKPSGWENHDTWIWVPAGSFTMGSPSTETYHSVTEDPNHAVTFAKGFWIGKYEVTTETYEACVTQGYKGCTDPTVAAGYDGEGWGVNHSVARPGHPQNALVLSQAAAVCAWLGGALPTEAQWEYAATGPSHRMYPWGTAVPICARANFDNDALAGAPYGCTSGCTKPGCSGTLPVGETFNGVSWCGAFDMAGNVWEWCADYWHGSYTGAPTDGSAWMSPADLSNVIRGGGFGDRLTYGSLRSSARGATDPALAQAYVGVRCVRNPK